MDIDITMTDNMQPNDTTSHSSSLTGIGARLKHAREALRMTERDAANRLHLNPKFIVIMETEDFQNGPPATFMRGYLRSYAKMLNLPEHEVNQAIEQLGMTAPSTNIASPLLHTPLSSNSDRYVRWITYLIILLLVMLVGMWWSARENHEASEVNKAQSAMVRPLQTAPVSSPANPAMKPAPATSQPVASMPPQQSAGAVPAAPATPVAATPATSTPATPVTAAPATSTPAAPVVAAPATPAIATPAAPAQAVPAQPVTPETMQQAPATTEQPTADKPKDLSHMKMVTPEPGLDTSESDNGDEDYDR